MLALAIFTTPAFKRFALAFVLSTAAVTLACGEASAQYYNNSTSFGASFNTSSSRGYGPGGFYNTGSRSSSWNASINSSRGGFGPSGYNSSGFNLNAGGYRSNSWGRGVGPAGPWGYQNRDRGGYVNGGYWNRGW